MHTKLCTETPQGRDPSVHKKINRETRTEVNGLAHCRVRRRSFANTVMTLRGTFHQMNYHSVTFGKTTARRVLWP
jgi:hypothetical protein